MLEIRHLVKSFGPLVAVDDVSFTVPQGEVLGFLGPNGAGKSTTMKMITGFLAPTAGTAIICGYDIATQPIAAKRRIGYLPEGAPAYPDMTPADFLDFIAHIRGFSGDEATRRIGRVVEMMIALSGRIAVMTVRISYFWFGSSPSVGSSRISTSGSCRSA